MVGGFLRDGGGVNRGEVRVYGRSGSNAWNLAGAMTASDGADSSYFGLAVSMDDTRAAVGGTDALGSVGPGRVYILK